MEVVVKTLDQVEEEAETGLYPRNQLGEAVVVGSSMAAEEVAVNQSQRQEEVVEGSLAGPLRHLRCVGAAVEEGGCPLQVEVEESWLARVAGEWQALENSWQPKEVVEEGGLGLEVVGEGPQPVVEVEVEVVKHFQTPEKTEYNVMIQPVQEGGGAHFYITCFTRQGQAAEMCPTFPIIPPTVSAFLA